MFHKAIFCLIYLLVLLPPLSLLRLFGPDTLDLGGVRSFGIGSQTSIPRVSETEFLVLLVRTVKNIYLFYQI